MDVALTAVIDPVAGAVPPTPPPWPPAPPAPACGPAVAVLVELPPASWLTANPHPAISPTARTPAASLAFIREGRFGVRPAFGSAGGSTGWPGPFRSPAAGSPAEGKRSVE